MQNTFGERLQTEESLRDNFNQGNGEDYRNNASKGQNLTSDRQVNSTIQQKYEDIVNGQTQMKFGGSVIGSANTSGFRQDGGPADIKKTFLYNQKLTTGVFQILEENPDKENQQKEIAIRIEQLFKDDYNRKQAILEQTRQRLQEQIIQNQARQKRI